MKLLTVCSAGNVRSVTLRYAFQHLGKKHDILACGADVNTPETLDLLYKWADYILITYPELKQQIPEKYHNKMQEWIIGPDYWGQACVPALLMFCLNLVQTKEGDLK